MKTIVDIISCNFTKYRLSNNIFKYEKEIDLSIIVPVYNTEQYIKECIDSLLNQNTRYNYEIIVIDDGSCDKSIEIVKKIKSEKIRIITQKNKGASAARNNGIVNSKGNYLSFVDSDDYVSDNFVQTMMDTVIQKGADIVKCSYYEKKNNELKEIKYKKHIFKQNDMGIERIKGHACMCVIKRDFFLNILFPEGFWYEDIIMKLLIYPQAKIIVVLDEPLYYYRILFNSTSRSISNKKNIKSLSQIALLQDILDIKIKNDYLNDDKNFYNNMMFELYGISWLRIRHLERVTKYKAFLLLTEINIKLDKYKGDPNLAKKIQSLVLKKKKYYLWNVISMIEIFIIRILKR